MELHTRLSSKILNKEIDIALLCRTIQNLDIHNRNLLFVLIIHYWIVTCKNKEMAMKKIENMLDNKKSNIFIYGSKKCIGGRGFIFPINKIPRQLLSIIYFFIQEVSSPVCDNTSDVFF